MIKVYACFFFLSQLEGVDTGDFEAVNAAAFLLSTESSKTIFIAVKDDDLPEADETFTFNLKLQVKALLFCLQILLFICGCDTFPLQSCVCCIYVPVTVFGLMMTPSSSLMRSFMERQAFSPQSPTVLILPMTVLNPNPSYEAIGSGGVTQ